MTDPVGPAALFDRLAEDYEQAGVAWFDPIAERLVAELAPLPGERALDVGRGAALRPLAAAVGPAGGVLGVDAAPRMVAAARQALDLPQVQVRVGNAVALDLPADTYDLVTASLVLFFLPEPVAALAGWRQLLRPGGRLGITTFGPQDERWLQVDALFGPYVPAGLRDPRTTGRQGPYASDAGVEDLLTAAGLEQVRTVRWQATAVLDGPDQWYAWTRSLGQRAIWDAMAEPDIRTLRRQAAELLEGMRDADGRIRLHQVVRATLGRRPG